MAIYMYIATVLVHTTHSNIFASLTKFFYSFAHLLSLYDISPNFFNSNALGDLSCLFHKIGQGHPMVMIYINFVGLYSQMLHVKFQNRRPSGSGDCKRFNINSRDGHLAHVTWIIYINFCSQFLDLKVWL